MVVVDHSGDVAAANNQARVMFGEIPEVLVGRPVLELVPGAVELVGMLRQGTSADDLRSVELGEVTLHAFRQDGSSFAAAISMEPFESEGQVYVSAAIRDITGVRRDERLFRGVLEAAPDAMVILNVAGRIVLVNARTESLFDYDRADLVGQSIERLVPSGLAAAHETFRSGYQLDREQVFRSTLELRARRRGREEFPVEVSLSPLESDDGLLVVASLRDVTERNRLMAQAEQVKNEFLATVSHELRTPLTSILGYSELLAELDGLDQEARSFVEVIRRNADRELRLVNDLLTVATLDGSGLAVDQRDMDLAVVVRDSVQRARPTTHAAGIHLTLTIPAPGQGSTMTGDPDRLGQVVDNLLSNALKFTPSGGRVHVSVSADQGRAVVEVADTGPGIAVTHRERLFDRMYRGPDAVNRQVPGAGLGLAITKAIVDAHEGSIEISDAAGQGAVFRVELPLRPLPNAARAPSSG